MGKKIRCKRGHLRSESTAKPDAKGYVDCSKCIEIRRAEAKARRDEENARKRELFGPKKNGPSRIPPEERFWPKVAVGAEDECWMWLKSVKGPGYGVFWDGERLVGAHTFAYRSVHGEIPDGMVVRHVCDVPGCCNPSHLVVGSVAQNMADKSDRGRHHNQEKTHCPKGHEYDSAVLKPDGTVRKRVCKTCKRESYQRNKLSNMLKDEMV